MAVVGGLPSGNALVRLHQQLTVLATVLTVAELDNDVRIMIAALADTAVAAEPFLAGTDHTVLAEIRSALTHARHGRRDEARADLLIASCRLMHVLHAEQRRRTVAPAQPRTLDG
ncbi:MAG TPA: hypothetical protein VHC18_16200 [Amycolatopsis sp.]|nr:hypothetical protein [Amycolatopsis sp.]